MNQTSLRPAALLLLVLLLSACASDQAVLAPDTQAGDSLRAEYLVGKWCTNRELTSRANSDAGHSALTNVSQRYWKFRANGKWEESGSGWMYLLQGKWQLQLPDRLLLDPVRGNTAIYTASFRNSGIDLYLEDPQGQFLVLGRCD